MLRHKSSALPHIICTAARKPLKEAIDRAKRAVKRRFWLDTLYELQKHNREEKYQLRILKQREQQFKNREYFLRPAEECREPPPKRCLKEEVHSGCSALTVRRRRNWQRIAQREDFSECHAYLQNLERRRCPEHVVEYEEALLAFRSNLLPGKEE
jgi:hypothetical protein